MARGRKAKNTNIEATQAGNTNTGQGDTNIGAILGPRDNRDDGTRAVQYSACSAVQCSAVQCSALLYSTVEVSAVQYRTVAVAAGLMWTKFQLSQSLQSPSIQWGI